MFLLQHACSLIKPGLEVVAPTSAVGRVQLQSVWNLLVFQWALCFKETVVLFLALPQCCLLPHHVCFASVHLFCCRLVPRLMKHCGSLNWFVFVSVFVFFFCFFLGGGCLFVFCYPPPYSPPCSSSSKRDRLMWINGLSCLMPSAC